MTSNEVQCQLRLDMRVDEPTEFVYPSIWEKENQTGPAKHNGIVQYWAKELKSNSIDEVHVGIYDPQKKCWVWWLKVDPMSDFTDSGFRTETNVAGSVDADGKPNKDSYNNFKFLDPGATGKRTYQAWLIITVKGGGQTVASLNFEARARKVFWCSNNKIPVAERGFTKAWMWKTFNLHAVIPGSGDPDNPPAQDVAASDDPGTDGSSDRSYLWLAGGPSFEAAYKCLTPRGSFYVACHGSAGQINVDGTPRPGFKGPGSNAGTGENLAADKVDLTTCAKVHCTEVELLACKSGLLPGNPKPGADTCSVAKSFANSLAGTTGGGGTVAGYPSNVYPWFGKDEITIDAGHGYDCSTDLTGSELKEIVDYLYANMWSQAAQLNPPAVSAPGILSPGWVDSKSLSDVNVSCDAGVATEYARQTFNTQHPGHANYTFAVLKAIIRFVVSKSYLADHDDGSGNATKMDPIPVPGN